MKYLRRPLDAILEAAPLLWILFAAWLAILFFFSGSPPPEDMPTLIPFQDKLLHFVFFAGGGCALAAALSRSFQPKGLRLVAGTVITLALAGAFDEYNQQFVPGRAGLDPWDWIADLCGALCGALILIRLKKFARGEFAA
jgi:VanZ family protein